MLKNYDWDKGAEVRLYALQKTYPDAIPVLGGAVFAATAVAENDLDALVEYLVNAVTNPSSRVKNWRGGVVSICENFCHVCLVDPKLVELYMGYTFAELAQLLD